MREFYYQNKNNNEFVQVTSNIQWLEFVKDLIDGDDLHTYVVHKIDESEELPNPTSILVWSSSC